MKIIHISLFLSLTLSLLCGCGNTETNPDARDEKDPLVSQALTQIETRHFTAALQLLEKALDKKPQLARADLEAARIYHVDPDNRDYPRAIYHYRRYLEKRPDSAKAELIVKWIKQAQLNFAADILHSNPNDFMGEVNRLKRENAALRRQVEQFSSQVPTMAQAPQPAVTPQPAVPPQPAAAPQPIVVPQAPTPKPTPAAQSYIVQSGDTLSKISRKLYSDSAKWRIIYEANRSKMKSERDLKIGQTLIIPRLDIDANPRG